MLSTDIGIDLGTASILVYIRGKGVVLKEPSVVAFDRDTNKIKAIGEEARLMLGRTPGNASINRSPAIRFHIIRCNAQTHYHKIAKVGHEVGTIIM